MHSHTQQHHHPDAQQRPSPHSSTATDRNADNDDGNQDLGSVMRNLIENLVGLRGIWSSPLGSSGAGTEEERQQQLPLHTESTEGMTGPVSMRRIVLGDDEVIEFSIFSDPLFDDTSSYERNLSLMEQMGGAHRVGVEDPDTVTSLMSEEETRSVIDEDGVCPICQCSWSETGEGEDDRGERNGRNGAHRIPSLRRSVCGHVFCDTCIRPWLRMSNKCPLCRVNLIEHAAANRRTRTSGER